MLGSQEARENTTDEIVAVPAEKSQMHDTTPSDRNGNGTIEILEKEILDSREDAKEPGRTEDLKAGNIAYDPNLQKEIDQIETDLSALENNVKKRRLSKTEMAFVESELNLDLDTVTDADLDMHIQKLISDNNSHMEKSEKSDSKRAVETLTSTENTEAPADKDSNNTSIPQTSETKTSTREDEASKTVTTPAQEIKKIDTNGSDSTLSDKVTVGKQADVEMNNSASENNHEQKNEFNVVSTTTSSYKGISIPANSELFKESGTSSVLQAYRDLLNESNNSEKEVNHINAQLSALPLILTAPDYLSFNIQMLINTLPVLDNLATQILRIIAKGPYQKVMELVSNRESYTGIAFGNLVELFETTKRIYNSEESPFFTVENITFGLWKYGQPSPKFLRNREDTIEGTLRKVNLSTFLLATLGLIDLGFFFLNEAFLDVFCPPQNLDPRESLSFIQDKNLYEDWAPGTKYNNKILRFQKNQTKFLKAQAILYLELKTQAYISAIELGDRSKEDIIHDLFPDNMDEILLRRKDPFFESSGVKIERNSTLFTPAELDFLNRCDFRKQTLLQSGTDSSLMEKYEWIKFLNDLLEYVSKNVGFLIWGPKGKLSSELDKLNAMRKPNIPELEKEGFDALLHLKRKNMMDENGVADETSGSDDPNNRDESTHGVGAAPHESRKENVQGTGTMKPKTVKKTKQNRPSTFRRVWTSEEEEALKEGLKSKGTHWTAILELYGPGGQINENLKNRSSLQLKDKARNWKMYYIKNDLPIPDYLIKATGDTEKFKKPYMDIKKPKAKSKTPYKSKLLHSSEAKDESNGEPPSKKPKTGASDMSEYRNGNGNNTGEANDDSAAPVSETHDVTDTVYREMIKELLPGEKDPGKADDMAHDEVAASELKDLVAEAFQ